MAASDSSRYWVGFDLGGTKMPAKVYDDSFTELSRKRRRTRGAEGAKSGLQRICKTIAEALEEAGVSPDRVGGIGVGSPGPLDLDRGVILDTPNLGWKNVKLKGMLEKAFGCRDGGRGRLPVLRGCEPGRRQVLPVLRKLPLQAVPQVQEGDPSRHCLLRRLRIQHAGSGAGRSQARGAVHELATLVHQEDVRAPAVGREVLLSNCDDILVAVIVEVTPGEVNFGVGSGDRARAARQEGCVLGEAGPLNVELSLAWRGENAGRS